MSDSQTRDYEKLFRKELEMATIDMARTGQNIKNIRIKHGMTIDDLCTACGGISRTAVCKWQNGTSMPTIDNFVILSDIWDIPIDRIIVRR